jgi:hypothetical protein
VVLRANLSREHQHSQLTSRALDFKDTLPNARRHGGRISLFREPQAIQGLVRSPLIKEQRDVRGDQNWRQAI